MVIPRATCGVSHQPDPGASGYLQHGSKNHAAEAEATFLRIGQLGRGEQAADSMRKAPEPAGNYARWGSIIYDGIT